MSTNRRHPSEVPSRQSGCRPATSPRGPRGDALPQDAVCSACGERDRRVLRWVRLGAEGVALCANDATRVRASAVRPTSVTEALLLLLDVLDDHDVAVRASAPPPPPPPPARALGARPLAFAARAL